MVLYYGLLALETANNTAASKRVCISKKSEVSIEKMSSTSNSWIYTEDLRKRFEERYIDYHYILIPVYIDKKKSYRTELISPKSLDEHSWIYSRSVRNHLFHSTSTCSVTNQILMEKKTSKMKFFQRSSSVKEKLSASLSPFKYQTNHSVEEDNEESTENENYSVPLIKHESAVSSCTTTEPSNGNYTPMNSRVNDDLGITKSNATTANSNRLTRLRSFLFRSSSSLAGTQ